jgi:hypothetical protein
MAVVLNLTMFLFVSAAYPQSLADLAKKEKERRDAIKNSRVISNEEAAKYITEPPAQSAAQERPPASAEPGNDDRAGPSGSEWDNANPDEPTDFMGRPESFWRETMAAARQKVKDLTNEANVIVLKIADLQNRFYAMDDGFNRETLGRDIQKTFYEQDLNKENLEKAKSELQDLEKEARKSGALPGWIAAKN